MRIKKIIKRTFIISSLLLMLGTPMMIVSALATINAGTTTNFAILAGSAITNTGSTVISGTGGDIGLHPGTSFVGAAGVTTSGAVHIADAVASIAKNDLETVYNQINSILPVTRIPSELGGQNLTPGIYDSADGTFQITGALTLNAQGDEDAVFIFKSASSLITASQSSVNLINNAQYCQVLWLVGSSATLGTDSDFAGRVYALQSITATTGASIQGQLLARNGAVTLDTNIITNANCASNITVANGNYPSVTIDGGQLPDTATNLYQLLFGGILLLVTGISTLVLSRSYAKVKPKK